MGCSGSLYHKLAWVVVALAASYNFEDPYAEHTTQAIEYDRQGRAEESLRAFQSAAAFTPSTRTFVNLGVCYMRMASRSADRGQKVALYHESKGAMSRGHQLARTIDDEKLYAENWGALMTNFEIENVEEVENVEFKPSLPWLEEEDDGPVYDSRQCGPPPERPRVVRPKRKESIDSSRVRKFLVHQRDVPVAEPLPRVSVGDLDGIRRYAERRDAFVLTGAMATWRSVAEASVSSTEAWKWLDGLAAKWPRAVVDFYPYNMLSKERQSPFLARLPRAVFELRIVNSPAQQSDNASTFVYDRTALEGRYLHLQLTPNMWGALEDDGQLDERRHWHLHNDDWLDDCFGHREDLRTEYHIKTHWKIVLAGGRGAGMFNHSDSLQTSSWHAHVAGRKWWYVCGTLSTGQRGKCFEGVLEPGDILYYGRGWFHETQNLETPTITLTDTAMHARNFEAIAERLHSECARKALDFKFSAALCDALDSCYDALYSRFAGRPKPRSSFPPWRTLASPDIIKEREATLATHNNYDGRNYITD